jgi:hypothetical protein
MSLWIVIGFALVAIAILIALTAWIVSTIEGFKVNVGWGLFNLAVCLFPVPQLIFSLTKLGDRWPLLILTVGCVIPAVAGLFLLFVEGVLTAAA